MNTTFRLAVRNTLRRRARSLLTAGMVVFGVGALLVGLTWIRGASNSVMATAAALGGHVRVVTKEYAAREELLPLYENLPEARPLAERVAREPGVVAVEPRITTGVTVTVGEEIGEVFALAVGASERYFREQMRAKEKLMAGGWFTGAADEVVVGAKVAERTSAKVGDALVLVGATQDGSLSSVKARVVGIFRAGNAMDQQVLLPIERVQELTDIPVGATELLVFGKDYQAGPALAAQLRAMPELGKLEVQSWSDREPWKTMAAGVQGIQSVIVLIFVLLASLGIWNTMTMSVLERTHEIGVLRAMGMSRLGTMRLFVGESLAIGVIGGLVGVLLGLYPAWLLATKGLHIGERTASSTVIGAETIYGDLSLNSVLTAFTIGLVMAVLGSIGPALRAASIQPVSAMRSGR